MPAVGGAGIPVPIDLEQGPLFQPLVPAGLEGSQGGLVRAEERGALGTVHRHGHTVLDGVQQTGHAQYRGDLQGPGQDGRMAGLSAHLGEDGAYMLLGKAHRHGGGQIVDHQNGALGQGGQIHALGVEQDAQHSGADVADIGGALAHELVLYPGKHGDKGLADGVQGLFGALAGVDGLFHLGEHEGIFQHHDLTGEDGSLCLPQAVGYVIGHGLGALGKEVCRRAQSGLFLLRPGKGNGGIVQILLPHADRCADSNACGGAHTV